VALTRALVPLLIGLSLIVLGTVGPVSSDNPFSARMSTMLVGWSAGLVSLALGVLMARSTFVRRASITVDSVRLLIEHPGVLRGPVTLERRDTRSIAVVDEPARLRRFVRRDDHRFRLEGSSSAPELPRYVYGRAIGSPFPLLSNARDAPNVVVVLERPQMLVTARRTLKFFASIAPLHLVRPAQRARGLLLRVKDPDAFRRALAEWDVHDMITTRDVLDVAPDVAAFNRSRSATARARLAIAALIALNISGPILAQGPGPTNLSVTPDLVNPVP
jgi:hypothetical protein